MKKQELKKLLEGYIDNRQRANELIEKIGKLKDSMPEAEVKYNSPSNISGMPSGNTYRDVIADSVIAAVDEYIYLLNHVYAPELQRITTELLRIEFVIGQLYPKERTIIEDKYVEGLTWRAIAAKRNMSEGNIYKIRCKAISNMTEAWNNTYEHNE